MEPKYIQPFLTATTKVLKTMAFTVPKAGEHYIKTDKKTMGDVFVKGASSFLTTGIFI